MNLNSLLFKVFFKIKVIHSMPGRMRIHIPLSHTVPQEWSALLDNTDLSLSIPGIETVSFSSKTGNALIRYQHLILSEDDVLEIIDKVAVILMNNGEALQRAARQGREQAVEHLQKLLRAHFGDPSSAAADSLRSE